MSTKDVNVFLVKENNQGSVLKDSPFTNKAKLSIAWVVADNRCNPGERIYHVNSWRSNSFAQGTIINKYRNDQGRYVIEYMPDDQVLSYSDYKELNHGQEKAYWNSRDLGPANMPQAVAIVKYDNGDVKVIARYERDMHQDFAPHMAQWQFWKHKALHPNVNVEIVGTEILKIFHNPDAKKNAMEYKQIVAQSLKVAIGDKLVNKDRPLAQEQTMYVAEPVLA